nr:EOG090X0AGI [Scapholeberis mucronata]
MMAVSTTVSTIREAWLRLHGVICVYKPTRVSCPKLRELIVNNICRDINQLEPSPPRSYAKIESRVTETETGVAVNYEVSSVPNLADHELVRGPAIIHEDIRMGWAYTIGARTSGVVVLGINKGNRNVREYAQSKPTSTYHVKGVLGLATDNHWEDGKVWEKTTYAHLTKGKIDQILSSIQATNQKKMFEYCGVDPTSQTAYELASKGLLRPALKGPPLIYGIKCIHFEPPDFTLEIHIINENEKYFATLVHDLGLTLKSSAVCRQIRCIRYGCFTVQDALLQKHWSLKFFPDNMSLCHSKLLALPKVQPLLTPYDQVQRPNTTSV